MPSERRLSYELPADKVVSSFRAQLRPFRGAGVAAQERRRIGRYLGMEIEVLVVEDLVVAAGRKPEIQPDEMLNELWRKSMLNIGNFLHHSTLSRQPHHGHGFNVIAPSLLSPHGKANRISATPAQLLGPGGARRHRGHC